MLLKSLPFHCARTAVARSCLIVPVLNADTIRDAK
jgi:hypothetical protein